MKQITKLIFTICSLFLIQTPICATDEKLVNFQNFIVEGISTNSYSVVDSHNNDMTNQFIKMYYSKNIETIYKFCSDNSLSIEYTDDVNNKGVTLFSTEQKITKSNKKYMFREDTTGKKSNSWYSTLTGTYYVNSSTKKVIGANSPTLSVTNSVANNVVINSKQPSYSINGSSITFKMNYHIYAGGYDFGVQTHSFTV